MNLKEHLEVARVEYVGAILESMAEQLDRCHLCLSVRFGEEIPGCWTYGSVRAVGGGYEGRVWQQSGIGPAARMVPGNLLVSIDLDLDEGEAYLCVQREGAPTMERAIRTSVDAEIVAGWIVDQWEALVCQARGYTPLDTNRRCYV